MFAGWVTERHSEEKAHREPHVDDLDCTVRLPIIAGWIHSLFLCLTMRSLLLALCLGLAPVVSGASAAWNDFVSYGQVAAKPTVRRRPMRHNAPLNPGHLRPVTVR